MITDMLLWALWNLFTADNHTCWAGRPAVGNTLTAQISSSTETPEFDIIIMNPPFTRDSLRHDQFLPQYETILKKREKWLLREHIAGGTLHMSSQGNNFVVLADRLTRDGGTMAVVLPMVNRNQSIQSRYSSVYCR